MTSSHDAIMDMGGYLQSGTLHLYLEDCPYRATDSEQELDVVFRCGTASEFWENLSEAIEDAYNGPVRVSLHEVDIADKDITEQNSNYVSGHLCDVHNEACYSFTGMVS